MYTDNQTTKQAAMVQMQNAQIASAPRDKPPTMVEMDALVGAFQRLENTADALDDQLGLVKNHNRAQLASGETGGAVPSCSPLVEYLRTMTSRANALQTRLASLRDIIEV